MRGLRALRDWTGVGVKGAAAALAALTVLGAAGDAAASATPSLKPPPPGPMFAGAEDLPRLEAVREATARREWARARSLAETVSDPVARSLAHWFYFYAEDPQVDVEAIDAFLDAHPGWPAERRIQLHAEKRLANASREAVLAFFATRDPASGEGALALARAQLAAGQREAGELRLRDAWANHNFTLSDEQRLLAQHGGLLDADDHAARVDRQLWSREVTAARRVFSRLSSGERRKAEARAALLQGAANGPALYGALNDEDRADSGVMHAAVRYYRRAGAEPVAVAIARKAPTDPAALRNPARWWEERQLLMRWALTERQYADAYAMASGHGLEPGGSEFAEAEFNAGWIALRFLGAPDRAETHFAALAAGVSAPISLSRAWYWLARAAEARGENALADARYVQAAEHVYTYYGQLAAEQIGGLQAARGFAAPITPTAEETARFEARPVARALKILADLKADQPFLIFSYQLDDDLDSPGEYVLLKQVAQRIGATHVIVRAGKVGIGRGAFAPEVAYPVIAIPDEATRFVAPEVILALTRQESEFNPRAFSHAGARGLMQLIPATAQLTARKERMRYDRAALINDPYYNMILGSAHLSHLLERYDGSLVMTFAAYNAGASRVEQWVGRYGDPRDGSVDPLDWIEQIPFAETRNYVQRVLENMQVYRARLGDVAIAGRLAADIERGGPSGRAGRLAGIDAGELAPLQDRIVRIAANSPKLPPLANALADAGATAAEAAPAVAATPLTQPRRRSRAPRIEMQPAPNRAPEAVEERAPPTPASPIAFAGEDEPPPASDGSGSDRFAEEDSAQRPPPILGSLQDPALTAEECRTYRDYIAASEGEEASADDLNAGMRAEFESGGPGC